MVNRIVDIHFIGNIDCRVQPVLVKICKLVIILVSMERVISMQRRRGEEGESQTFGRE